MGCARHSARHSAGGRHAVCRRRSALERRTLAPRRRCSAAGVTPWRATALCAMIATRCRRCGAMRARALGAECARGHVFARPPALPPVAVREEVGRQDDGDDPGATPRAHQAQFDGAGAVGDLGCECYPPRPRTAPLPHRVLLSTLSTGSGSPRDGHVGGRCGSVCWRFCACTRLRSRVLGQMWYGVSDIPGCLFRCRKLAQRLRLARVGT